MFLDETIDPDIPTDPNELALYKRYGRNWRNVVMGSTTRDRGGNFDRGMRFMHTTPEGFMQRPSMQSTQQVQQSNIDQSGYFAQLQKLQDEYNQALQDYYKYMSTPQYDQMQDYYAGNYQDYYGGGGGSQDNPYVAPPPPALDPPPAVPAGGTITSSTGERGLNLGGNTKPDATIFGNGNTGTTKTQPYVILPRAEQTTAAYKQMAKNNAASAAAAPASNVRDGDSLFGGYGSERAPAAPIAKAPTLNSLIQRYERAEATGNDNPKVKDVEPVKTVVKKSVTPVKVWGNRNN